MIRRFIVMFVLAGLVLGGIFGWKFYAGMQAREAMVSMSLPPATVSTAEASEVSWLPVISAVGSMRALQGVNVTAQVAGQITELHFDSGDPVQAGDLLARQYTADDEARLEGLVADRQLAEVNFKRAEELIGEELISDTDYDTRRADLKRARAVEVNLRLLIEQKSIRAPFSGRLGIRQIDVGQYIEPGDNIVRLESLDSMLVEFPVPQQELANLKVGQSLSVSVDAWPDQRFSGRIRAIEPQVARETRTLRVQGEIVNTGERLVPGMFVQVTVDLPEREQLVTVPQAAVTYSPYGNSVFVVTDADDGGLQVRNTFVETGATRGDQVVITAGLEAGATVVTAGQQKLRNGSRVQVDNSVVVSNAPDPLPDNN
jgi:membrane fusion protein (multidrug efflux system)